MQLHLHPTRHEALTAGDTTITRWSLETSPAAILAQRSTAPASVFYHLYGPSGHLHTYGGISGSPDGVCFAYAQRNRLEWHHWDDLSLARANTVPDQGYGIGGSLACSPDGRWLVLEGVEELFLLEWQTGKVLSRHATGTNYTSGLTFDATSRWVAGVFSSEDGGGRALAR